MEAEGGTGQDGKSERGIVKKGKSKRVAEYQIGTRSFYLSSQKLAEVRKKKPGRGDQKGELGRGSDLFMSHSFWAARFFMLIPV